MSTDPLPPTDPPGLDLRRLGAYLDEVRPGTLVGPVSGTVIAGGKSNLTYRLDGSDGRSVVLRRPPLGNVLPTAHDMPREFRVIEALHPTGFPVPEALHLCADPDVIGAPFYLMSYVDGRVLRTAADIDGLTTADARRAGEMLVDTLLALHAVDPDAIGLGDFGRPSGYLERQVRRWHQQWERSKTRELPALEEVAAALAQHTPVTARTSIVHGDYRLDNVMVDASVEHILAVLDWEMATLGDPLADLGLLVVYVELAASGMAPTQPKFGPPQGFPTAAALVERYAGGVGGLAVDGIGWYVALGYYKLAIISEGIHARFLAGRTVGAGFERMGESVPFLIDLARAALGDRYIETEPGII